MSEHHQQQDRVEPAEAVPQRGPFKRVLASLGLLPILRPIWRSVQITFALPIAIVRNPGCLPAAVRFLMRARRLCARRAQAERLSVAIDISPFWEPLTGIGWYLYRLLETLADRQDLEIRMYGPDLIPLHSERGPVVDLPQGRALEHVRYPLGAELEPLVTVIGRFRGALSAWLVRRDRNRVAFAPNYFLPRRLRFAQAPLVATIHDLGFRHFPETLQEETRLELKRNLHQTTTRAALILTDSEAVRAEILADGMVPPERVRTVHLAVGIDPKAAAPLPNSFPRRYVLHVGTIEPRKRIDLLIEAFASVRQKALDDGSPEDFPSLVLCGRLGWKTSAIETAIARGVEEGWLIHLGYAEADLVPTLYRHATLVALPSVYEGFGLPALEALALGAPLLASDIPVLREVAGDAARYVAPDDVAAWIGALKELIGDASLRERLAKAGPHRAGEFTWEATAESVVAAWRSAASTARP